MEAFMEECEHLKCLNLKEIKSITGDFDKNNIIGEGGFGKVYKGVLSHSSGAQIRAAFKRLDSKFGQGNPEFLKEIFMLSRYTHENLISLLGFCDEDGEKILAYEHASHGSLDRHLSSPTLSWTQRLEICLGAARGLCYLHDPKDTQQRVIHRDIKSSNILLDENWNAKVSDMGLSKIGPANQPHTFLATNVVGTFCYIDPMYMETNILTKESDVYSFGVVLFEVLCGRLCFENYNNHFQSLVPIWKKSCKQKKLDEIIFHHLKQDMDHRSLVTFSEIAYLCLQKSRTQRPEMCDVVEKLEIALRFQQKIPQMLEFEEMVKTTVNKRELDMLLSKGILLNEGNTWLSLNKNGEHIEMISGECFISTSIGNLRDYVPYGGENKSRFEVRKRTGLYDRFSANVRTHFLSPNIQYTVNLVFKCNYKRTDFLGLSYMLAGETKNLIAFVAHERGDGWLMAELYQVISDTRYIDLEISFRCRNLIEVEGIEFQPLERHEKNVEDEEVDMQTISHPDTYWEQKLPLDYAVIIKRSKDRLKWTTNKELYTILCKGLLLADDEEWFSLAKNGKNCHMLSARLAFGYSYWRWKWEWQSLPQSSSFEIDCQSDMLSTQTTYATYLVYKIEKNHSNFDTPLEVSMSLDSSYLNNSWYIYLRNPQAPLIRRKVSQKKGITQQRNHEWKEVQIWEFQTDTTTRNFSVNLRLRHSNDNPLIGLIVNGIEFRPI